MTQLDVSASSELDTDSTSSDGPGDAGRDRLLAREREARAESDRRAHAEVALRGVARALGATMDIREAVQRISEGAVETTSACGAYVERFSQPRAGGEIEVVAAAGEGTPPLGTRVPYPGSLSEEIVEHGEPTLMTEIGAIGERMAPYLTESCRGCTGLLVPLLSGRETLGALVMLRAQDGGHFDDEEIGRARILGDLASAALRRLLLLQSEREARDEAEARRREIADVLESRSRLMRGFSHDVKNPLGAADGYAALLADGVLGEITDAQREAIGGIRRSIRYALDLIDDLHELARAESGRIELACEEVDVGCVVRELAEDYRASAEAKGLELRIEIDGELPPVVSDTTRVRQILGNLLSNAVKYTDDGSVAVRATAKGPDAPPGARAEADRWLVVAVSDTGLGISAEDQQHLFLEFSRLHQGEKPGAGLGLAISQRVARALGGAITVHSEAERGAEFTLWLPVSEAPTTT